MVVVRKIISRHELAERWGCSVELIDGLRKKGLLKFFNFGRLKRIFDDAADEALSKLKSLHEAVLVEAPQPQQKQPKVADRLPYVRKTKRGRPPKIQGGSNPTPSKTKAKRPPCVHSTKAYKASRRALRAFRTPAPMTE